MGLFNWLRNIVSLPGKAERVSVVTEPGDHLPTQPDQLMQSGSHKSQGNAFLGQGKLDEAAASYRQAIAENPLDADARLNLGFVLSEQEHYEEAERALRQALEINPALADAFYILGVMSKAQENLAGTIENLTRAVELKPDFEIIYSELCQLLFQSGQTERARDIILKGISLCPERADFHYYLGNLYAAENNADQAINCFLKALSIQPDHAQVYFSLGHTFRKLGRYEEALVNYDHAILLKPDFVDAFNDRGIVLGWLGRYEESLPNFRRVLQIQPQHAHALSNLGMMLTNLGRHDDAVFSFAELIELVPDYPYAIGYLFGAQIHSCDWSLYASNLDRINRAVIEGKRAVVPFTFLAAAESPALQLQCTQTYVADVYPPSRSPLWTGQHYQHDKIRIAYLSADFHDHATAYLMAELFELHDQERFEIVAISFGPDSKGGMRERLRRSLRQFVDVRRKSDHEVASLLREKEIDIAIDLKGFTTDSRAGILAQRPCPIQVNYLGFPGSIGGNYIDYILADPYVIPLAHQDYYAEKIVWLPDTYQVNDSQRRIAQRTPTRLESGLPEAGFIFCCFNNNYKITPDVFDVWMRLLNEVKGSVLWLLEDNVSASRNLRVEAVRRGVAAGRLVFAPRMNLEEHLARHRLADLFLDTRPCNAHTTASDALWSGLPVITCMGNTFPGRVAASLLNAVGLPELITERLEEYEALSLKLATSPALLSEIREKLRRNRSNFPLVDAKRFCIHLESAYTFMWERYQRGELPISFAVPPLS